MRSRKISLIYAKKILTYILTLPNKLYTFIIKRFIGEISVFLEYFLDCINRCCCGIS